MKALRYLLIVIGLMSLLSANAQGLAQQPEAMMQSTSVMQGSGSSLPSAAVNGVSTTYSPAKISSKPRRAASEDDGGDTPPPDPHGPNEDPIGDAMLPLALLALGYFALRVYRRKNHLTNK